MQIEEAKVDIILQDLHNSSHSEKAKFNIIVLLFIQNSSKSLTSLPPLRLLAKLAYFSALFQDINRCFICNTPQKKNICNTPQKKKTFMEQFVFHILAFFCSVLVKNWATGISLPCLIHTIF